MSFTDLALRGAHDVISEYGIKIRDSLVEYFQDRYLDYYSELEQKYGDSPECKSSFEMVLNDVIRNDTHLSLRHLRLISDSCRNIMNSDFDELSKLMEIENMSYVEVVEPLLSFFGIGSQCSPDNVMNPITKLVCISIGDELLHKQIPQPVAHDPVTDGVMEEYMSDAIHDIFRFKFALLASKILYYATGAFLFV